MIDCVAEAGSPRTCGLVSTYNNAGCRGEACRAAVAAYRRVQRSKANSDQPMEEPPTEESQHE